MLPRQTKSTLSFPELSAIAAGRNLSIQQRTVAASADFDVGRRNEKSTPNDHASERDTLALFFSHDWNAVEGEDDWC